MHCVSTQPPHSPPALIYSYFCWMKKNTTLFLLLISAFLFCNHAAQAQSDTCEKCIEEIHQFQKQLNAEFADSTQSPLSAEELKNFQGLDFFPINLKYRVQAQLIRTPDEKPFKMKTTTSREPEYVKYGVVQFALDGRTYTLNVYQSLRLRQMDQYKNSIFLPFTDLTNGNETYGGGRYIDLQIPKGNTITINFNMAYNPSCAYNHRYSCPVPPKANFIDTKILAGVKAYKAEK